MKRAHHQYLAGGFKQILFSIIKQGCHPSHWRSPSFFKMVIFYHQPALWRLVDLGDPPMGARLGACWAPVIHRGSKWATVCCWAVRGKRPTSSTWFRNFAWENPWAGYKRGLEGLKTTRLPDKRNDGHREEHDRWFWFDQVGIGNYPNLPGLGTCIRAFLCDVCIIYIYHKKWSICIGCMGAS